MRKHAQNILNDGELLEQAVVKKNFTTATDRKKYRTRLYRLEMILAIGVRIKGVRGTQFRQWAGAHLKEYLVKDLVTGDGRLKKPVAEVTSLRC